MRRPTLMSSVVVLALMTTLAITTATANSVTDWNTHWLDCIRATGGPPCPISRAGAMVHAAIYDAVISIRRTHQPYLSYVQAPRFTSRDAAVAQAGHDVLVALYPGRQAILDAALASSLDGIPNGPAKSAGITAGQAASSAILLNRQGDGSDDATPYPLGTDPGDWQPTFPDFTAQPFSPNWGHVRCFAMTRGDQFRPAGPLGTTDVASILRSPQYAHQFREVKEFGSRASRKRTDYESGTAFFWANDVNGTYKPPGHLNHIAQVLADQQRLSVVETARLFALLNITLGDAGIVAWDCKYQTSCDLWRPISGIRLADTDGNPHTDADPLWEPLNPFTPPFPAYISGHSTFAGAAAAVFGNFFGTNRITHTISTDDPFYVGGSRTYRSFTDAAEENAASRIYLGVHWRFDTEDGLTCGKHLGDYVSRTILLPAAADDDFVAPALEIASDPLRGQTVVEFELPVAGMVRATVHDVQGRRVANLAEATFPAGRQSVSWDGRGANGGPIQSGVYFVRVEGPGVSASGKVIVAR